jgi:hypothetical protein
MSGPVTRPTPYTRTGREARLLGGRQQYDIADGIRHFLYWAAIRDDILSAELAG